VALKEKEVRVFFCVFSSLPRAASSFHATRTSHDIQRKNQKISWPCDFIAELSEN
jgi:hypothetical protein